MKLIDIQPFDCGMQLAILVRAVDGTRHAFRLKSRFPLTQESLRYFIRQQLRRMI